MTLADDEYNNVQSIIDLNNIAIMKIYHNYFWLELSTKGVTDHMITVELLLQ